MRLPEQRLWDRMRAQLRPRGFRLERVENLLGAGMPDVLGHKPGFPLFLVELKMQESPPKRHGTPLLGKSKGLSLDQINWHVNWRTSDALFVLIGWRGEGGAHRFALVRGMWSDAVNEMSAAEIESIAAARDDWDAVAAVLCGSKMKENGK